MTTEDAARNLSPSERFRRRRAQFKSAHVPVDANGKPTGEPTTYTYDDAGKLTDAKPADDA